MTPPDINSDIEQRTDAYFTRTREVVQHFGDVPVTYALFLRRPVISAPRALLTWLAQLAAETATPLTPTLLHPEGAWVGAGEPILTVQGPMAALVEAETLMLQKLGAPCVAAHHAYQMCAALPDAAFIAMEARHCAGAEMQSLMAYAASVGSAAAQKEGAKGFIGSSSALGAPFFGGTEGLGTMPHALIGYAGSTLRAAEMFLEACPDRDLTILTDYFGREVTDALEVATRFPDLAAQGRLAVRLDTHGGRFLEGLDPASSYAVLDRRAPRAIRRYRSDAELRDLVGTGVSAAAIWRMREALDDAGFPRVRIVASSGFGVRKCQVMADTAAPIDTVGTGSFIPTDWHETYATADIIDYNGTPRVKLGREFLLRPPVEPQPAPPRSTP